VSYLPAESFQWLKQRAIHIRKAEKSKLMLDESKDEDY